MIIWTPVPRDSLDIPDKALSKEEKGQLHPQCPRELVWEWSLASSSPCRPQLLQDLGCTSTPLTWTLFIFHSFSHLVYFQHLG